MPLLTLQASTEAKKQAQVSSMCSCPFEALNLGQDQMHLYLSDVQSRLADRKWTKCSYETQMNTIAESASPEDRATIQQMKTKFKREFHSMLVPLRRKVFEQAKTILEISFLGTEATKAHQECVKQMEDAFESINQDVKSGFKVLEDMIGTHEAKIKNLAQQESKHNRTSMVYAVVMVITVLFCMVAGGPVASCITISGDAPSCSVQSARASAWIESNATGYDVEELETHVPWDETAWEMEATKKAFQQFRIGEKVHVIENFDSDALGSVVHVSKGFLGEIVKKSTEWNEMAIKFDNVDQHVWVSWMNYWKLEKVAEQVVVCPQETSNSVAYNGYVYRTLSGSGKEESLSCMHHNYHDLPSGWEIAPFQQDVLSFVVRPYSWRASRMHFATGTYYTHGQTCCDTSADHISQSGMAYYTRDCYWAILIRQKCPKEKGVEGKARQLQHEADKAAAFAKSEAAKKTGAAKKKVAERRDAARKEAAEAKVKLDAINAMEFRMVAAFSLSVLIACFTFGVWNMKEFSHLLQSITSSKMVSSIQISFLDNNVEMLGGVELAIGDLNSTVEMYKSLDPSRHVRVQDCLSEIAKKLFAMSMSMDEYIVWLSVNDFFPGNTSIRAMMGHARYDLLMDCIPDAKRHLDSSIQYPSGEQINHKLECSDAMDQVADGRDIDLQVRDVDESKSNSTIGENKAAMMVKMISKNRHSDNGSCVENTCSDDITQRDKEAIDLIEDVGPEDSASQLRHETAQTRIAWHTVSPPASVCSGSGLSWSIVSMAGDVARCFMPETLFTMWPCGEHKLQASLLSKGSFVTSFAGKKLEVVAIAQAWSKTIVKMTAGDAILLVTPTHRVMVPSDEEGSPPCDFQARNLKVGDNVICSHGVHKLDSVDLIEYSDEVPVLQISFNPDEPVAVFPPAQSILSKGHRINQAHGRRGGKSYQKRKANRDIGQEGDDKDKAPVLPSLDCADERDSHLSIPDTQYTWTCVG